MYRAVLFIAAVAFLPLIVAGAIVDDDQALMGEQDTNEELGLETEQESAGRVDDDAELSDEKEQELEVETQQETDGGMDDAGLSHDEQELGVSMPAAELSSEEQEAEHELDLESGEEEAEQELDTEAEQQGEESASEEQELDVETENEVELDLAKEERRPNAFLSRRSLSSLLTLDDGDLPSDTPVTIANGRHPAVARKLKDMGQDIKHLKIRHTVAEQARKTLEDEVKKVNAKVNDVITIKAQMANTQAQIHREDRKLKKSEEDLVHLDRTHQKLSSSLHHIMGSKIDFATARLSKRKAQLKSLTAKADAWKAKEAQFHAASLSMLDHRRKSKAHVAFLAAEEQRIHKERIMAEKELHAAKVETRNDIAGYQYSDAEVKAAMSKQQRGEEETAQAETSVKRLSQILIMEEKRVDESMSHGKDKVLGKINQLEADKRKSNEKLMELNQEYSEWQDEIHAGANRLDAVKTNTDAAAKLYSDSKQNMLKAANDRVILDAESDSDWGWDDWGKE